MSTEQQEVQEGIENQEAEGQVEGQDAGEQGEGGEQAAGEQPPKEKVTFDDAQQAVFNKAIGRQHKQTEDQKRANDTLQAENERLQGLVPQAQRPETPAIPARYDFDSDEAHAAAIATRDTVIQEQANFDANQQFNQRQEEAANLARQNEANNALNLSVTTYTERAEKMNISPADLQAASDTINAYGIQDAVVTHILGDEQGPMMTMFLAKNPAELMALSAMTPMQAAVKIAVDIKPKLGEVSNISNAPPPPDTLDGGGLGASKRGPKGATFE